MRQILKVLAISLVIAMALQFIPATALRTYAENLSEPETVPETIDSISESAAPASYSLLVYIVFDNGTYDGLNRVKEQKIVGYSPLISTYEYGEDGSLTSLNTGLGKFTYEYDDNGNIVGITNSKGTEKTYDYNGYAQLIRENDSEQNATFVYTG